jgi:hypothetical protein
MNIISHTVSFQSFLMKFGPLWASGNGSKKEIDTAGYGFAVFHNGRLVGWAPGNLAAKKSLTQKSTIF